MTATIIDLGLSRMKDADGRIYYTTFEPEIFEGQGTHLRNAADYKLKQITSLGDYQFDVYRLMRDTHGTDWENFKPLTNVMVRTLLAAAAGIRLMRDISVATLPRHQDAEA